MILEVAVVLWFVAPPKQDHSEYLGNNDDSYWEETESMTETVKAGRAYKCDACEGVFNASPDWTDEDAEKELHSTFGKVPLSECAIICDDCYERGKSRGYVPPKAH